MTDPMPDTGGTKFAFLICSERSGSNLMSAILGSHSQVSAPPPFHLGRDFIQNHHTMLGLGAAAPAWEKIKRHLVTTVARVHSEEVAANLATWLDTSDADPCKVYRYVHARLDPKPGAELIFIKENNLHKTMPFILSCFPDAKFIFQVRDPRDYLASAKALKNVWLSNKFGSNRNALTVWREDQIGGLQTLALLGPERVKFQRYEDLVSDPRRVLVSLCEFLGITFEDSMLSFHENQDTAKFARKGTARENLARPLMSSNFGKYRKTLSRGQIKMTEAYLGDLMARFGYALDFGVAAKRSALRMMRQQLLEPIERLMNGEKRPFYSTVQTSFAVKVEADAPALVSGDNPQAKPQGDAAHDV